MRFEIIIDEFLAEEPILKVILFYRKDNSPEGIYNCASIIPKDQKELMKVIEQSVNACLNKCEEDLDKYIREIIKKNQPSIDKYMEMCFPYGVI